MPPPFVKKKKRGSLYPVLLHEEDKTKKISYVNLTVLDATDAVYSMVHSKVSETQKNWIGTKIFKDRVAHTVAQTASTKVPPKVIVKALSAKLPKMLMYQMYHKMGMRLAAQTVYREDNFAVIQIQVQQVDSKRLLAQAREDMRKSSYIQAEGEGEGEAEDDDDSVATAVLDEWIEEQKKLMKEQLESPFVTDAQDNVDAETTTWSALSWREAIVTVLAWILTKLMPVTITKHLEENNLPAIIQSQISKNLKAMLHKKLASKHLKAEAEVLTEDQQARYFFAQLQKIRTKEEKPKLDLLQESVVLDPVA